MYTNSRGQIKKLGEKNVQNLFLLIHATKYVSLNILKLYPQIMLRNRIFLGRKLKIINESANFWNLLTIALNINVLTNICPKVFLQLMNVPVYCFPV